MQQALSHPFVRTRPGEGPLAHLDDSLGTRLVRFARAAAAVHMARGGLHAGRERAGGGPEAGGVQAAVHTEVER